MKVREGKEGERRKLIKKEQKKSEIKGEVNERKVTYKEK